MFGIFAFEASVILSDLELFEQFLPFALVPTLIVMIVLGLYLQSVLLHPVAYYDPVEGILTTVDMYRRKREWPKCSDVGVLVAGNGRIIFVNRRGRRRVVLSRFESNPVQFDAVYRVIDKADS